MMLFIDGLLNIHQKYALWSCETNNNECQKLSFSDISKQSTRLANVLTGKEYDLKPGKNSRFFNQLTNNK